MKKLSYLLGVALVTLFASCDKQDNAVADQEILPVSTTEQFIEAAAKGGDIFVAPGAQITLSDEVVLTQPVTIISDVDNPATITFGEKGISTNSKFILNNVIINAQNLTTPLVKMSEMTLAEDQKSVEIDIIQFDQVTVLGLNQQLFYCNKQSYLIGTLDVESSLINIAGAAKKTIFDFNGGGNVENLNINNSTIYADAATQWQNGGFFSTQSSKEVIDLGGEEKSQNFTIKNSTLYNICKGKTVCTLRKNNQAYQYYTVKHNIIFNCGKKNEFLVGLATGRINKKENWTAEQNVINWQDAGSEVEDLSASEEAKSGLEDPTWEFRITSFADPEKGNFKQSVTLAGDPRWTE